MNEIADLPINAFRATKGRRKPDTLEGGGGGKSPTPPAPAKPPQTPKAPQSGVYRDRAQSAGKGGMSAGYQSTLLTGVDGVQQDSVAGIATMPRQQRPTGSTGVFL